jgi:hypothetical protein
LQVRTAEKTATLGSSELQPVDEKTATLGSSQLQPVEEKTANLGESTANLNDVELLEIKKTAPRAPEVTGGLLSLAKNPKSALPSAASFRADAKGILNLAKSSLKAPPVSRFQDWTTAALKELLVFHNVDLRGANRAPHSYIVRICDECFPPDTPLPDMPVGLSLVEITILDRAVHRIQRKYIRKKAESIAARSALSVSAQRSGNNEHGQAVNLLDNHDLGYVLVVRVRVRRKNETAALSQQQNERVIDVLFICAQLFCIAIIFS